MLASFLSSLTFLHLHQGFPNRQQRSVIKLTVCGETFSCILSLLHNLYQKPDICNTYIISTISKIDGLCVHYNNAARFRERYTMNNCLTVECMYVALDTVMYCIQYALYWPVMYILLL